MLLWATTIALGILMAVFVVMYWKPICRVVWWIVRTVFTLAVFGGLAFVLGN